MKKSELKYIIEALNFGFNKTRVLRDSDQEDFYNLFANAINSCEEAIRAKESAESLTVSENEQQQKICVHDFNLVAENRDFGVHLTIKCCKCGVKQL